MAKVTDKSELALRQRLMQFDRGTERQRKRERTRIVDSGKDRGWTRAELYMRTVKPWSA